MLFDSVKLAHASNPTNDSERLVFRELFQTLIYIDCHGAVRPGLARSWIPDQSRRTWTFSLRDDVSSVETPPAAVDVVSTWRARTQELKASGIESVAALVDGRLVVTMATAADSVPRIFADPMLGVAHNRGSILGRDDRFLIVRPHPAAKPVEFRVEPGSNPRDALDGEADLLISRDPSVVEYASGRPEFRTIHLPWSRTYILVQPFRTDPVRTLIASDSVGQSLARDAVPADARPAQPPFWWEQVSSCPPRPITTAIPPSSSRIVYPFGDRVAQGLAERIVALTSGDTPVSAAALPSAQLAAAIRARSERGYVLPVPARTLAPCRVMSGWPADASIHPLIETRASAIVRRGSPTMAVDWDGTVRLLDPGPQE